MDDWEDTHAPCDDMHAPCDEEYCTLLEPHAYEHHFYQQEGGHVDEEEEEFWGMEPLPGLSLNVPVTKLTAWAQKLKPTYVGVCVVAI